MTFGEKVSSARKKVGLTQTELASMIKVSDRTIQNYENDKRRPRTMQGFRDLAAALKVDVNYLLTDDEAFVMEAKSKYGFEGGSQAAQLLVNAGALFAGGELSEEDMTKVHNALEEIFWDAKRKNKEKYGKKD